MRSGKIAKLFLYFRPKEIAAEVKIPQCIAVRSFVEET